MFTISQPHFRPNQNDLLIVENDSTVVTDIPVTDRHADINQHILADWILNDAGEHLPRV